MTQSVMDFQTKDDIFVVKFYKNDRTAADTYMARILPEIKQHSVANKPMLIVLDISIAGMFSLQYTAHQMQTALADISPVPIMYIAYLTNDMQDKVLVEMMNSLTARKVAHTRRIFPADGLDDALAWLKSNL